MADYPDFVTSTCYGTGAGLMGWNCRHNFYPFYEGISERAYTDDELNQLQTRTVKYNGEDYTDFTASQMQRSMERNIRQTKRMLIATDEAIKATDDEALLVSLRDDFSRQSVRLKQQEAKLDDFLAQTSRTEEIARVQVQGFGKSQARRATAAKETKMLPRYKKATIPDEKLTAYALNKEHSVGKHKALVFEKVLGYNTDNKDLLIARVREGLGLFPATMREKTKYGQPFEVIMKIKGVNDRTARVKTGWLIEEGKKEPRLTNIYVDDQEGL